MAIKLTKVRATVTAGGVGGQTKTYMFLAPKGLYTGSIATETGCEQVIDGDADADEPVYTVGELIKARKISRITVRTLEGTTVRTMQMVCTLAQLASAHDDLKGKAVTVDGAKVSGSVIKEVVGKRSATFY
ncbi:hypothetical protein H6G27_09920 [Nostoc linckia FACHB-104]|nr:hypothetical protein [Nostoc linckia FACHB-104]